MKFGFVFLPFAMILLVIGLYTLKTMNFIDPLYKEGMSILAFITFLIYLVLVVFQPYEKK
jgi:hypothetical protein